MNNIKLIVDETDNNPYRSLNVNKQFDIESYLGFIDGFTYDVLYKSDFIEFLSDNTIKLVLNICQLPHTPKIYVSDFLKNKINTDNDTYLWIFSPHEATLDHNNFAISLKKQGFNLDKIIVTNSDSNVDEHKIAGVRYVSFPEWWEAYYRFLVKTKQGVSFITPNERKNTLKSVIKKSLCLNRNVKIHRVWTYYYLLKTGLYQDSFYSYHVPSMAKKDGLNFKTWIEKELIDYQTDLNPKEIIKEKKIFKDVELDEIDYNYVINLQPKVKQYYKRSALSLITESLENYDFLTEKTFKSIVHSHPFVTIGGKGINSRLKERGYELFDDIFGCEHIEDTKQCFDVMNKLNNLSLDALIKYNLDIHERIEHNWNNFFKRKIHFENLLYKIGKVLNE
jgi:hypothetical protein